VVCQAFDKHSYLSVFLFSHSRDSIWQAEFYNGYVKYGRIRKKEKIEYSQIERVSTGDFGARWNLWRKRTQVQIYLNGEAGERTKCAGSGN